MLILTEMLARALKNVFRHCMRQLVVSAGAAFTEGELLTEVLTCAVAVLDESDEEMHGDAVTLVRASG